jgi:hypothetical protein
MYDTSFIPALFPCEQQILDRITAMHITTTAAGGGGVTGGGFDLNPFANYFGATSSSSSSWPSSFLGAFGPSVQDELIKLFKLHPRPPASFPKFIDEKFNSLTASSSSPSPLSTQISCVKRGGSIRFGRMLPYNPAAGFKVTVDRVHGLEKMLNLCFLSF